MHGQRRGDDIQYSEVLSDASGIFNPCSLVHSEWTDPWYNG
jgi:hypothetical protein